MTSLRLLSGAFFSKNGLRYANKYSISNLTNSRSTYYRSMTSVMSLVPQLTGPGSVPGNDSTHTFNKYHPINRKGRI